MVCDMPEEVKTIVKIPLEEIEESVRSKHVLPKLLSDVHVEERFLVLTFVDELTTGSETIELISQEGGKKRRRSRKKRNRMKTRGWSVVARITNSKGQKCTIYKPFVDALDTPKLASDEQKKLVERILRSNRNKPSEDSTQYFLENTLEYLRQKKVAFKPSRGEHEEGGN
jgi:hypothetical protein